MYAFKGMLLSQVSGLLEIKSALRCADGCVSGSREKMDVDSGADDDHILVVEKNTESDSRNGSVSSMNMLCGGREEGASMCWVAVMIT